MQDEGEEQTQSQGHQHHAGLRIHEIKVVTGR